MKIDRRTYADHYGPTTGDRIRLADTDLIIEIEDDATTYGDEAKFGGGKVIRDGMGQSTVASRAAGSFPLNFGCLGKGNSSGRDALREQIRAGALGLKLHEDWGTTPAAIDECLTVADEFDVQVAIHTDTLNETGFVEDTIAAIKGRTIHTYHTEGAGGGHAPDILRLRGQPNALPSATNPTMPFTRNTLDEHLDMLMVC